MDMRFDFFPLLRSIVLWSLLTYPIMAIRWIPLGGGARYMSVLAGPLGLLLLTQVPREKAVEALRAAGRWSLPFLPFVIAWLGVQFWHGYAPVDWAPLSRLFWGAVLFTAARLVGLSYYHLAIAAAIGSIVYGVDALIEVYGFARERAWGGTYENRFGEYAIWLATLCWLHLVFSKLGDYSVGFRRFLMGASLFGLIGSVLSGARGSLMALPVVLLAMLVHARGRRLAWYIAGSATLFVLALGLFYPPIAERFAQAFYEVRGYFDDPVFRPTSIGIRLELARISLLMLHEHPWFGPGLTSLGQLFSTHPSLGTPDPELLAIPGFHSDFSQLIGIGGGILLAGFAFTVACWISSARRDPYRLCFLAIALVFGLSEVFFCNKLGLSLFVVLWALYAAAGENMSEQTS